MGRIDFNIGITDKQYKFIIQTVLTLVASNYAHIPQSYLNKGIIDYIYSSFIKSKVITNNKQLQDFVIETANSLHSNFSELKMGFCYFSINLIIKRLVPLIQYDPINEDLLDAPLNKNELFDIPSRYKSISSICNKYAYIELMGAAHKKASSLKQSLYSWELSKFNLK